MPSETTRARHEAVRPALHRGDLGDLGGLPHPPYCHLRIDLDDLPSIGVDLGDLPSMADCHLRQCLCDHSRPIAVSVPLAASGSAIRRASQPPQLALDEIAPGRTGPHGTAGCAMAR